MYSYVVAFHIIVELIVIKRERYSYLFDFKNERYFRAPSLIKKIPPPDLLHPLQATQLLTLARLLA